MTIDEFLEIGEIRRQSRKFKDKWKKAVELSAEQLSTHDHPYVAVSGGKDSNVLAYLVAEAAKLAGSEIRLWSHLSDASFPGTEETVQAVARRLGIPVDVDFCPFSAFDAISSPQRRAFGKSGVFYTAVRTYAADKDLAFVGVRASESNRRRRAANVNGQVFHSASMGDVDVCYPLLWFRLEGIAAAIVEYDIPIHPIYYKQPTNLGKNGQDEDNFIRLGYVTSRDLLNRGTTVFLRLNYPDIYAKLEAAWPEIRNET